jgi:hypothetical protein
LTEVENSLQRNDNYEGLLFEIEKDNIFAESALLIQYASYHIKYLVSKSEGDLKTQREHQLQEWYQTLIVQLRAAVMWLQNVQVR